MATKVGRKIKRAVKGALTAGLSEATRKLDQRVNAKQDKRQDRRQGKQEERQATRKERQAEKIDRSALGGSLEEEKRIQDEARADTQAAGQERREARADLEGRQRATGSLENLALVRQGQDRYRQTQALDAQEASIGGIGAGAGQASSILGGAYGTNALTGSAESILGQRAAAMGAAPTYAQLADQAIAAQTANMRDQTGFAQSQLARRAMGTAAGMGEGGALGAQQAMASLIAAGGDLSAQSALQNAAMAGDMRAQAAMAQRGETVGEADFASQARLAAAQQERANQLATAGQQAELAYNAGLATNAARAAHTGAAQSAYNTGTANALNLTGQANDLSQTETQASLQNKGISSGYQSNILGARFGADQAKIANTEAPMWKKVLTFGLAKG